MIPRPRRQASLPYNRAIEGGLHEEEVVSTQDNKPHTSFYVHYSWLQHELFNLCYSYCVSCCKLRKSRAQCKSKDGRLMYVSVIISLCVCWEVNCSHVRYLATPSTNLPIVVLMQQVSGRWMFSKLPNTVETVLYLNCCLGMLSGTRGCGRRARRGEQWLLEFFSLPFESRHSDTFLM